MSTKPRNIFPGHIYHVYNRAADGRTIFYTEEDYNYFLQKILLYKERTGVKEWAYVLIPNHWHFILEEPEKPLTRQVKSDPTGRKQNKPQISAISEFISLISNSYTKYFNISKNHSGRIFQSPFKSKLVSDDAYLNTLIAYVNLNPLKHKMVKNIDDWPYTSHHDYLYKDRPRVKSKMIDQDCLIDFREYYEEDIKRYIKKLSQTEEEFEE